MTAQLRSEFRKVTTTNTLAVLLLAAVGVTVLGVASEGVSPSAVELAREQTQRNVFSADLTAVLFATIGGIIVVTSEFRYGTMRPTLLFEPRRGVVFASKLVMAGLAGVVVAVACVAVAFAGGLGLLAVRDVNVDLSAGHAIQLIFGPIAASVLSAMIGVALGMLVRNQLGAIVALLAYAVAVDAGLFAAAPSVGHFLPGKSGDALAGLPVDNLLAPATGALVLTLWLTAFVIVAAIRTNRSDC